MDYKSAIVIIVILAAGWLSRGWYDDSHEARMMAAIAKTQQAATTAAAQEIAKIQVTNMTIQKRLETRIVTEKVYTECRHSPESFKLIQDAFK